MDDMTSPAGIPPGTFLAEWRLPSDLSENLRDPVRIQPIYPMNWSRDTRFKCLFPPGKSIA